MDSGTGTVHVLYVSGDSGFGARTAHVLETSDRDLAVTVVTDAADVIKKLGTGTFDCIVSEQELAEIDGIQLLQIIRATAPDIPFILCARTGSKQLVSAAISARADEYLENIDQPAQLETLASRIRIVVSQKASQTKTVPDHEQAKRILEAAPDGIVVTVEGEVVYCNEAAVNIFEAEHKERLLGKGISTLTQKSAECWIETAGRNLRRRQESIQTPAGKPLDVEVAAAEITWEGTAGHVAVIRDITEKEQHEYALEERVKELSAIHRTVNLFECSEQPIEEVLNAFVETLPQSFQYPARTEARVTYGTVCAATSLFEPTEHSLAANATTTDGQAVAIEVVYTDGHPQTGGDLFLDEERELIETLVTILSGYLERREYTDDLERYETTLKALGDPVYALDPEGHFTFVNDALVERTGHKKGSLLGEHTSIILPPEAVERGKDVIEQLLSTAEKQTAKWEMDLITATGERIPAENHVALLPFDEDGSFRGTAGVIRDISERVERKQELERRRDLLVRTERMANVGGWELDLETETLYWTDGTRQIHDVSLAYEPTLEEGIRFYPPEDRKQLREAIEACRESGQSYDLELRLITAKGRERWVHTRGERVEEDGRQKLRGTIQNITERKENEQQLMVLNRVLRHNLRNNLNVVTANAELLRNQIERLEALENVPSETHKQLRSVASGLDDEIDPDVIEDCLEVCLTFPFAETVERLDRLEANAWELLTLAEKARELSTAIEQMDREEAVDIDSLLRALITEYEKAYPEATISLETTADSADVNPASIRLAIEELLENALKHNDNPEPVVSIRVDRHSEERIRITLTDNGPGIPETERGALDSGKETALEHGSGVGLWTVNWLLSRLGGTITIEQTKAGTAVCVELPTR